MAQFLADVLLVTHTSFVLFVVFGLLLTWIGWIRKWSWVRNFWFRLVHLICITYVAIQAVMGKMCPLTVWEDRLRGVTNPGPGFIERWLARVLYYDLPDIFFISLYAGFGIVVILTFVLFPPHFPRRFQRRRPQVPS